MATFSNLLIWILLVIIQVFVHYYMIHVKHTKPNYLQWFIIRGMVAIFHGILFNPSNMTDYLPVFIFQVSSHVLIFAPLLNYIRGMSLDYLGEKSGWFDSFFRKRKKLYYAFMLIMLAVFVGSFIYLL